MNSDIEDLLTETRSNIAIYINEYGCDDDDDDYEDYGDTKQIYPTQMNERHQGPK